MADYLFINGTILTMNPETPRAEAVLTRADQIRFVGSEAEAKAQMAPHTQVIDLQGQCLMPGFHDSHVHLGQHGFELSQLNLSKAATKEEGLALVAQAAREVPEGEWILGAGFLMARWGVSELGKLELDQVAPNHPVLLRSQDHHSAWVNSLALERAKISATTPNPAEGEIVKDADGEPTGLILERAVGLISDVIPEVSDEALSRAIRAAADHFASLGITTVHHMSYDSADQWREMALQASQEEYSVRVWACIRQEDIEHAAALGLATGQGGKHFQVGGAKFFADGALGSLTALMKEPYEGTTTRGVEIHGRKVLQERFPLAIAAGLTPVIHAIGDAANETVLDVLEETQPLWQAKKMRPRIEHAQHLTPKDIARFARLGVIASMQPIHFRFDAVRTAELLGERINTTHAWRSLTDSGAVLPLGSDTPVATPDVIEGLKAAVRRQAESGQVYGREQVLTITEALAGYTRHAAYCINWEGRSGQLKAGFDADLVILSHDPQQTLEGLEVISTLKAGYWTYGGRV
ncbi:MAG: amidohydrolase [Trueperaceae bacterium]|nr:amidohydrolase [Trueperaceae bacterium]